MNSRHLVDPELLAVLDAQPEIDLTAERLSFLRTQFAEQLAALPVNENPAVSVEQIIVPATSKSPSVRMLAYRPTDAALNLPAILHIHGGGYISGMPEMNDTENRSLAVSLSCAIFSVDYRLAPENPHSAPVEDCYSVLNYLHIHAAGLKIDAGTRP